MTDSTPQQSEFQFKSLNSADYAPWVAEHGLNAPYGMCQCGCGGNAPIAKRTHRYLGHVKGQPTRFVNGHWMKERELSISVTEQRFWTKVDKSDGPDACWIWRGNLSQKGYGLFRVRGRIILAHRASWELHHGPIPEHDSYHGICVLHKCDNGSGGCVNPSHLFLGTQADNMRDMVAKGRKAISKGERNPRSILTTDDVLKIRMMYREGKSPREISRMYKISDSAIYSIVHRKRWKHVP